MADAFDKIVGQPQVREFLRTSVRADRVSHAYLFCGPKGSGKRRAAFALAKALLCEHKGDDTCEVCRRIERRKHPDVHYLKPEGANHQYLVEQIREIVANVSLAPIQSNHKVYIIHEADRMTASAANAFLKTLEEPPEDVTIILTSITRANVLPTLVSRCQVVPFPAIPAEKAAEIVVQHTGASLEKARYALSACGGSITRSVEFLRSNEQLEFRRTVLRILCDLRTSDPWAITSSVRDLMVQVKAPLDNVRARQEAELAENADFLARSAIRQIEARNKRELSARTRESVDQIVSIASSFLHDALATCAGTPEFVVNVDVKAQIEDVAAHCDEARVARAYTAISRCNDALNSNVSTQTCIDALFFEIREALYGSHSAC